MPGESQISRPSVRFDAARRDLDLGIERICRRQKQLVRLEQLVALGLTPSGVDKRVARRRLHRLHRGVFSVHPPPYSRHQAMLAAIFACGPGSLISDLTCASFLGYTELAPSPTHVTNATGSGRSLRGIVVHQRAVEPRDTLIRSGIPCTSPARMILDCSAALDLEHLEDLLMAADSGSPRLDRRRLEQLIEASRGRRGIRNLRWLTTADPKQTRSINERRMLTICRRFGLIEPETNYRIDVGARTFYADFCWPELRLVVEADSWTWHGGRQASENDADRDQLLSVAGWRVVHFTRNQIKLQAERTGRRLLALTLGPLSRSSSRRFADNASADLRLMSRERGSGS